MNPHDRHLHTIAERAAIDPVVRDTLRDNAVDPDVGPEAIFEQLRRLDVRGRNALVTDLQGHDLADERRNHQAAVIHAMSERGRGHWERLMDDVRDKARQIVDRSAPEALRAMESGDERRYEAMREHIDGSVQVMLDDVKDARASVRDVMRSVLSAERRTFTTQERAQLIDSGSTKLPLPSVVSQASSVPLDLDRAKLRQEQGLAPEPGNALSSSPRMRPSGPRGP